MFINEDTIKYYLINYCGHDEFMKHTITDVHTTNKTIYYTRRYDNKNSRYMNVVFESIPLSEFNIYIISLRKTKINKIKERCLK